MPVFTLDEVYGAPRSATIPGLPEPDTLSGAMVSTPAADPLAAPPPPMQAPIFSLEQVMGGAAATPMQPPTDIIPPPPDPAAAINATTGLWAMGTPPSPNAVMADLYVIRQAGDHDTNLKGAEAALIVKHNGANPAAWTPEIRNQFRSLVDEIVPGADLTKLPNLLEVDRANRKLSETEAPADQPVVQQLKQIGETSDRADVKAGTAFVKNIIQNYGTDPSAWPEDARRQFDATMRATLRPIAVDLQQSRLDEILRVDRLNSETREVGWEPDLIRDLPPAVYQAIREQRQKDQIDSMAESRKQQGRTGLVGAIITGVEQAGGDMLSLAARGGATAQSLVGSGAETVGRIADAVSPIGMIGRAVTGREGPFTELGRGIGNASPFQKLDPLSGQPISGADQLNHYVGDLERAAERADGKEGSGRFLRGVRSATRSLIPSVAGAQLGGLPGAIGYAATNRFNQGLTEATDAGKTGWDRTRYAAEVGLIEGVTTAVLSKIGAGGFEKALTSGVSGGVREAVKQIPRRMLEESFEEVAIELADSAVQTLEGVDATAATPERLAETVKQTLVTTAVMMGATEGGRVAGSAAFGEEQRPAGPAAVPQGEPPRARFSTAQDTAAVLATPEGAAQFAQENPDAARSLAENPSRKQFTSTFGLREEDVGKNLPKSTRDQIAAQLQSALGASAAPAEAAPVEEQPGQIEPVQTAPPAESPAIPAPTVEEAVDRFLAEKPEFAAAQAKEPPLAGREFEVVVGYPEPSEGFGAAFQTLLQERLAANPELGKSDPEIKPPELPGEDGRFFDPLGVTQPMPDAVPVTPGDQTPVGATPTATKPAEIPAEPAGDQPAGFVTSQGSTYTWDGTRSQRTKSKHQGHDPGDVGQKELSDRTVFIDEDAARRVGMWQTSSAKGKRVAIQGDEIVLISKNPKTQADGIDERFPFSTAPEVGRHPLELWDQNDKGWYRKNHPGSAITELTGLTSHPDAHGRPSASESVRVSAITRADVENTFKGATIEDAADGRGWRVKLASGRAVEVQLVDKIAVPDRAKVEARYGKQFSDAQWSKLEEVGAKGSFKLRSDGMELDTIGLIKLSTGRNADAKTLRHEAIHFARAAGLFGEKEWNTLVEKYSDPSRPAEQQEEDIARASKAWETGKALPQKIRKFARDTLDRLGIKLDADTVQALLETEEFWSRPKPDAAPSPQPTPEAAETKPKPAPQPTESPKPPPEIDRVLNTRTQNGPIEQTMRDVMIRGGNKSYEGWLKFAANAEAAKKFDEATMRQAWDTVRAGLHPGMQGAVTLATPQAEPAPQTPPEAPQTQPVAETTQEPEQAPAETQPATAEAEPATDSTPEQRLSDAVAAALDGGSNLNPARFFAMADEAYGGTRAEGRYGPSEAYDALELGVNKHLKGKTDPTVAAREAVGQAETISQVQKRLPSQTNRSGNKDVLQQFSTPPHYAYAVAWAANIGKGDVVLEPSAGTGDLAVQAMNAGATVYGNELDPRRAALLRQLEPADVFLEDAEQIHNSLPGRMPAPTIVLMNPPFSHAGERMGTKTISGTDLKHIDAALDLLADNGRLVAIIGAGLHGETKTLKNWLAKTGERYNVRAHLLVSRDVYKGYGTTFPTRVLVIDKTAPSESATLTGATGSIADLIQKLEGIRNDRSTATQSQPAESGGEIRTQEPQGGRRPAVSVQSPTGGMDAGQRAGSDPASERPVRTADAPSADVPVEPGQRPESSTGRGPGVQPDGQPSDGSRSAGTREPAGGEPAGQPIAAEPDAAPAEPVERLDVEKADDRERRGELTESLFEPYRPAKVKFSGAKKHPASIVESAPMAAVDPPTPTYRPSLPKDVVASGKLSEVQLETIVYAGQAHEQTLPDGSRQGFMLGDGTGVGKGRQIAGVILDNWQQGRKRAVWISVSQKLFEDAKRDWSGLGGDAKALFNQNKLKAGEPVTAKEGILFTTYNTLKSEPKDKKSRLDQVVEWLGPDFDGVIAFDEAHKMANLVSTRGSRGQTVVAQVALAGLALQEKLPKARVMYVSATAATDVRNLAYAQRLGLWGKDTPFQGVIDFISKISDGGVAAMELIARDMKAMGRYLSRNISFNDGTEKGTVTFRRLEHELSTQQRAIYDKLAEAWQGVLHNIDEALGIAGGEKDARTKSAIMSQFWGSHQRFFNQIMTAMQLPAVISDIEKQLAAGRSAVIQLTNTFGAQTERALGARKPAEDGDDDLSDFDITPREMLIQFVERSFPTMQFEEFIDPNGAKHSRPAYSTAGFTPQQQTEYASLKGDGARYDFRKKHGKQIQNREAVAMRDQLLDQLGSISVPSSPIDHIINHFGEKVVSEVTGRLRRVIEKVQEDGSKKTVVDKRGSKANQAEIDRFMAGKKRVLIFSEAGGTGASYHADITAANQQKRMHYLLQAGWKADAAVQGLGRSHRSNQKQTPEFILVTTDLKGQKRFISTIARRLAQLGALTKGERKAGSTGVFSPADNLESTEAKDALIRFYRDLHGNRMESISIEDFERQTGLRLRDEQGQLLQTLPPITQFLNRLLSMNVDTQNAVFDEFDQRLQHTVEDAQRAGTLDQGTETLRASSIKKVEDRAVYTHDSGAETRYVKLKVRKAFEPVSYEEAVRSAGTGLLGFYRNPNTGRIFSAEKTNRTRTDRTGNVLERVRLNSPKGPDYVDADELESRFEEVGRDQAKDVWDAEFAATPPYKESTVHLVTGIMLPIWDRLTGRPQVMRMLTDDGEQLLGRVVPTTEIKNVLKALGAEATQEAIPPAQLLERLMRGEVTASLANGWKLKGARVQNERRVELIGPDFTYDREMDADGVFRERVGSKTRYFIPTGPTGVDVLKAVTKARPVVDVDELADGGTMALKSPQTIPVSMEKGGAQVSNHAIIRTMSEEFDVPIRVGRVRGAAAGIYKVKPEVVRMKSRFGGDLGVAAHEVAHHIDKTHRLVKGLPTALRQELGGLDYEPDKARDFEGFAEFLRLYLTYDDAAEQLAPQFYEHFTRHWLPAHKDVQAKLEKIKSLIDRWRQQGAGARIQANISKTGKPARPIDVPKLQWFGEQFRSAANKFYAAMKDEGHFLNLFTKEAKAKGYKGDPGESPFELYQAFTQTGPSFAKSAIENGVFSVKTMKKIGPSLQEVFAEIDPAEYDTFVSWMYARHAIESWEHGKHPGISLDDAQYWFEQHDSPRYQDAAQKFTAFNDALIDMLAEAGVIGEGTAQIIKDAYETYIPLHRVRDTIKGRAGTGRKLVNLPDPLKRRRGADLPIIDPVQATVERAVRFYERAAQQQVIERTVEAARRVQGMGGWIEQVPPNMVKTAVPLQEIWPTIADKLDAAGIDPELLENVDTSDILSIWRPDYYYKGDQPIARVLRSGGPELYQFDKDLFAAISGMNYFQLPYFLDITFGKATRLLKMGATGLSMSFGLRNPLRDYGTYLFQKKHAKDSPRGLLSPGEMIATYIYSNVQKLAGKDEDPFVVLWQEMGGELSQALGLDRKQLQKAVDNVVADSTKRRLLNIAKHPVELARDIIGITEVGPRLAEFKAVLEENGYTREKLKAGDFPPRNVLVQAINAANDVTVNFRRQGWLGKWLNKVIPFWNAPIEGADKFVRTWRDNPKRTFILSAMLAAATIAYAIDKDDEDWYEEAPPWLKYGFWTLTDDNGAPVARIPRPHEWGWTISAGTEAILNAIRDRDPAELKRYAKQASESLVPDPKPALVSPSIETYFNYDTFRNRPIVDRALENLKPEDQAHAHTTRLARGIGQWLGVSPAKAEFWLDQQTGGMFRGVVKPTEAMLAGEEMGGADIPGLGGFALRKDYSITVDEFYDEREKLTREVNSAKLKGEDPGEKAERLHLLNRYSDMMTELRRGVQGITNRDQRFSHEKYIVGLAREAMGKSRLERYPSPFRRGEVLPESVQAIVDDVNQSAVYMATDPDSERKPEEGLAEFRARQQKREASIEKSAAHLRKIGMTFEEAKAAFVTEWNARRRKAGLKVEPEPAEWERTRYGFKKTAFGERVERLRKLMAE